MEGTVNTAEKYIYQVYLAKSFSKAAKKLFVSQPSLSAAVAHKEKELGFQVFDRTTKPISLTPEGHVYLDMLEEMIESEKKMRLRVKRLFSERYDSISVGGRSSSAYYLIPLICGAFSRRYPEIEIKIDLGNFSAASALFERLTHYQRLDKGELDTVLGYEYDSNKYNGERIYDERLVVAMHRDLVTAELAPYAISRDELLHGTYAPEKEIKQKNMFRDIPFLDFLKTSNTRHYMTELLGEYTASVHQISNAIHSVVHFNLMCTGVAALLTGDCMIALSGGNHGDVVYFVFDEAVSKRKIYLITRKDAPVNSNTQKLIDIAKETCRSGLPLAFYQD